MSNRHIQIDMISEADGCVVCNLYTGNRCVRIYMTAHEYRLLIDDGFFIRTGQERDGAGVLNTTQTFYPT